MLSFDGSPVPKGLLDAMNSRMAHRGPDGEGVWLSGPLGLGHRRLSIIDPALGAQPFISDDGVDALSFNGEIYNYKELGAQLRDEAPLRTSSDTEVLLRAFAKWGPASLERLRGMFAFAFWDGARGVLHLVRDRAGIKPLFYCRTSKDFVFASELSALVASGRVPLRRRARSVASFLLYQYVPTPFTIYEDVFSLEPGCRLEVDLKSGSVRKFRYWELLPEIKPRPEAEALEELDALLDESIALHLRSDVPFGAFLSGGMDSSVVAAVMAKKLDSPVKSFSIGFGEGSASELPFAEEAARAVGAERFSKTVRPDFSEALLLEIAARFGEPFGDSSAIPTYFVSKEAAAHVKMVLSGDGGDELFGGYDSYRGSFKEFCLPSGPAKRVARAMRRAVCWMAGPRAPHSWRLASGVSPAEYHSLCRTAFGTGALRGLLSKELADVCPDVFEELVPGAIDVPLQQQFQDFKSYLHDDVLTKVDRMSMAHSLEVRVPLLDHKIIEFAFGLPLELRLRLSPAHPGGVDTKALLRRSAGRFFGDEFLNRPKQGFGIPFEAWCSGPFMPFIRAHLTDKSNPVFEWLRPEGVAALLEEHAGSGTGLLRLWYIFCLSLWAKSAASDAAKV
jgi:asparagine synthase (glutamine-hydrolysing)